MDIAERTGACARVTGELVHGGKCDAGIICDDRLGAVAMVSVEIPNSDALRALRERLERGYGDVIEITESHRLVARGVMTRRSHQTEGGSSA